MAILNRLAALVVLGALAISSGCYSPDLRDCTVTCGAGSACADDQVCGSDGFCASPAVAGSCASHAVVDAARDGATPTTVTIHITVKGTGRVTLDSTMTCDSAGAQKGDCTYAVAVKTAANLTAAPSSPGHPFTGWAGGSCSGPNPVCTFTPTADTTVAAMFK